MANDTTRMEAEKELSPSEKFGSPGQQIMRRMQKYVGMLDTWVDHTAETMRDWSAKLYFTKPRPTTNDRNNLPELFHASE